MCSDNLGILTRLFDTTFLVVRYLNRYYKFTVIHTSPLPLTAPETAFFTTFYPLYLVRLMSRQVSLSHLPTANLSHYFTYNIPTFVVQFICFVSKISINHFQHK